MNRFSLRAIFTARTVPLCAAAVLTAVAACTPDYSPNVYSANAVQVANKVEMGTVIGFREVEIKANGTIGAVSGGAAGGILGTQVGTVGIDMNTALAGVGGTAIGSIVGNTIEHFATDTTGWEYIVRKANGDLIALTQRQEQPIPVGQRVLVITGPQARIVPDYAKDVPPTPSQGAPHDDEVMRPVSPPHAVVSAPVHVASPPPVQPVPLPAAAPPLLPAAAPPRAVAPESQMPAAAAVAPPQPVEAAPPAPAAAPPDVTPAPAAATPTGTPSTDAPGAKATADDTATADPSKAEGPAPAP